MEQIQEIKKFVIIGYRWFDKVNGNTYHTINIIDVNTNESIYKSESLVYGYGEQYQHTAFDKLKELGFVKEDERFNHELNRKRFIYICNDVERKKNLF